MIKIIKKSFITICLILMTSCQMATLIDQSINKFLITATQGDFAAKVDVSWQKTDYYSHFEVLRSDSIDGYYTIVGNNVSSDTFSDYSIAVGSKYYYKVRGYNFVGTPMYVSDSAIGYAGSEGGFYPPDYVEANLGESTKSITLSWSRANNATEYSVNRSDTKDGRYIEILRTSFLHYTDSDVETGKTYYYRITSYDSDGGPSANSSTPISATVFGANLNLNTELNSKIIKILWTPYELATSYIVYRSEDQYAMGDVVSTINSLSKSAIEYIDTDVERGKLYYYTILYKNDVTIAKSETIRGFLQQADAPDKPVITSVSEGEHTDDITITWSTVSDATEYEVSRASSANGPWSMLDITEDTTYIDKNVPYSSSSYFYRVVAFNGATLSENSDVVQGWANRPPNNIVASQDYSTKVVLTWDAVPGADVYIVTFSTGGTFQPAEGEVIEDSDGNLSFEHIYDIGMDESKQIYYKVQVRSGDDLSSPSDTVVGKIQKMIAPPNLRVTSNMTKTKSMRILWDEVPGARKYIIYRVVLKHHNTDPDTLKPEYFSYFGESDNAAFDLSFTYPIRRSQYMVFAVDGEGLTGAASTSETVYRLPVDIEDFVQDVDFTINQAQRQISSFGALGSSGDIKGKGSGSYTYYAKITGSKSTWYLYNSYEIILDGDQPISTDIVNLSAKMNGDLNVTGLYRGTITYKDLNSQEGGIAIGGGLNITYDGKTEYWDYQKAANIMEALLISASDSPRDPNNPNSAIYTETGYGDNYQ